MRLYQVRLCSIVFHALLYALNLLSTIKTFVTDIQLLLRHATASSSNLLGIVKLLVQFGRWLLRFDELVIEVSEFDHHTSDELILALGV